MKTVLVTGANRGLGLGFVQHYLERGCEVIATARHPEDCTGFTTLAQQHGERFRSLQLDVGDSASIDAAARQLGDVRLDLLINNAGMNLDEAFGQWTADTFAILFAVNATGPALFAQALAPQIRQGGTLVNLSSGLASNGLSINLDNALDAYSASKSALNMITRRLAAKLEERDIVVAAFDPGWVRTDMGGEDADLSIDESIGDLAAAIDRLTPVQSGLFLSRTGEELPW